MPSVAEQLRNERENQKLTIYQIAESTKIKTDHIRALEEGNYDVFAAPIYIRGFVRNYASVLKLDVSATIKQLESELAQTPKFHEPPSLTGKRGGPLDFITLQLSKVNWQMSLWVIGIGLLLLIGFSGVTAWSNYKTRDPLVKLGPGLYHPSQPQGEILPLPPSR
jgi:cytoskeletal protein RodZ